jgi:succinyl-CoA synthetase beta subunit
MKLLEYEAKFILKTYDIPIPRGTVSDEYKDTAPPLPAVVKSQVPVGGRGKAGGIKVAKTNEEFEQTTKEVLALSIKGFTPRRVLYEELIDIDKEFYLSLTINRSLGNIELIAHSEGGVEIESHDSDEFLRKELSPRGFDAIGDSLAEFYNIPNKAFLLADLTEQLYECFVKSDATLLEINPLILTKQGEIIAGDCKMTLDDAASFRHPEWNFEDAPANANFVSLNEHGTVATIANGAGLAMATVDAVVAKGLTPANFLDIGGGATTEKVVESFKKIMTFPEVSAIVINIFGGIVRCDIVARAIIEAREQIPELPNLYIRLSGNSSEKAAEILKSKGLTLYDTLDACLEGIYP